MKLCKQAVEPPTLCDGYVLHKSPVLHAGCRELNVAVLDSFNKFGLIPGTRTIGTSAEPEKQRQVIAAEFSECRAEIADDVMQLSAVRPIYPQDLILQVK